MFNIVIVGVGGQGTLLASKILGQLAMNNGYEVRVSEVHGMSHPFWTISVQTVRFVFILCICDICFKNHSLRKVVFFISLHTGFFKIISLF